MLLTLMVILIVSIGMASFLKSSDGYLGVSETNVLHKQLAMRAMEHLERTQEFVRSEVQIAFRCHATGLNLPQNCNDPRFPTRVNNTDINPDLETTWRNTWIEERIVSAEFVHRLHQQIQTENSEVEIECLPIPSAANCTWNRRNFPKIFKLKVRAKDPHKGIVAQYTGNLEVAPDSIRNISYMVTDETGPTAADPATITFADTVFRGRAGVLFRDPTNPNNRIRFAHRQNLEFQDVFFTNINASQFDYVFQNANPNPAPRPHFAKGIATNVSSFSNELRQSFMNLKDGAGVIKPDPSVNRSNHLFKQSRFIMGNPRDNKDPNYVRLEYIGYVHDSAACVRALSNANPGTPLLNIQITCQAVPNINQAFVRPLRPETVFEGRIPPGAVFYAPSSLGNHRGFYGETTAEGGLIVESHDPVNAVAEIGRSNFTVISSGDVKLRSPIMKAQGVSNVEGNIAFVSLGEGSSASLESKGIVIDASSRTLIKDDDGKLMAFDEIIQSDHRIDSREKSFQVDASLVALAPGSSAPQFGSGTSRIVNQEGRRLGTFVTNGGLIGARFDPSRNIDATTGATTSGFESVELNFNLGALSSPPPGFSQSSSSLISSVITSLSLSVESAEDAIAALDHE